jgi:hypothetical protein
MSTDPPAQAQVPVGGGKRRLETASCLLIAALAGAFFFWSAVQPAHQWAFRTPDGYYPLLLEGFRSGHLHVSIEPNPELLALADPYDPTANAPYRVHDMSLYNGHYYLYYGATPIFLFFWPLVVLTGWYFREPVAVAFFCTAAVWAAIALLVAIRRRHFPAASPCALILGALCLAFATPLNRLVEAPQFYQVPISCAIFLQVLMLGALYKSLHSPRRPAWLAAAGLIFGLSVGARPNHLLDAAVILIPVAWASMLGNPSPEERKLRFNRLAKFALVPAAAIGAVLMIYNSQRFGSVTEFGMRYQLTGLENENQQAMTLSSLAPHLMQYLFQFGLWQPYFPYFSAQGFAPYGCLRYAPWMWLVFACVLPFSAREPGERAAQKPLLFALAAAAVVNLLFLSCFHGVTNRYPGDFAVAGLILAGAGALALSQKMDRRGWRLSVNLLLFACAAVSLFFALTSYASAFPDKDEFFGLARLLDTPAYWWQRSHGANFGGIRLEVRLPAHPQELPEPLFETGSQPDERDWLQVDYPDPGKARLSLFHAGTGLFEGAEFPIPPDRRIVVEIHSGSLMPPFSYPLFRDWSHDEFDRAHRDLQVTVNGTDVLRAAIECYDAPPSDLRIGRVGWFTGGMGQRFTGEVLSVARLPLVKPGLAVPAIKEPEPVELTLLLPPLRPGASDPLLVTGKGTQSDLIYCAYGPDNRVRFGLDHFGNGGPQSEFVPFDPLKPHTVTLWMASLAKDASSGRLVLIFDGHTLLNVKQQYYPGGTESALVGLNPYGATTAGKQFTGQIIRVAQVRLDTLPPPPKNTGAYGAVEMSVLFPPNMLGRGDPLVVTGVSGAGDFVYVKYVDLGHVIIGFDHWGVGGSLSDPIEVSYNDVHRIAISMDSLYPPDVRSRMPGTVRVSLDGDEVLEAPWHCYPSSDENITVGRNEIGGSTCGREFTGRILSVERFASPPK